MEIKEKNTTIAFFMPSLDVGGAERNVLNFIREIDKKKYQITLILAEKKGLFLKDIPEDISLINLNAPSLFWLLLKLVKYFRRKTPDIFISTFPRFNFVNSLAKILSCKKFIFIIIEQTTPSKLFITARKLSHKLIAYFFLSSLIKFFYKKADAIVCVSEAVKNDIGKFLNFSDKISVIYNPVIEEKIYQLGRHEVSDPWLKNKEIPVILAIGRLVKAKDYPTLIKAVALILKEKDVKLIILGEGDEEKNIIKISKELAVLENISFLGFQENPYKYLSKASVFVSSSLREGFSNAIVEAMACGAPVVSTDCEGPKEIIEDHKNGILVSVGDPNLLAKALLEVLNNPALSHKLSEAGKARAKDFTVEKSIKSYEDLFLRLMA